MEPNRRLYRSRKNRILAGVCGGIGEFTGIDPTVIRVLAILILGLGWLTYLILAIIIPCE